MASIKTVGKKPGIYVASLPLPNGTRRVYRFTRENSGTLAKILAVWKSDCEQITRGAILATITDYPVQ